MKVGISTGCLYPMLTEECIDVLAKLGFTSFEIFFNTFSELKDEYLDMLKYILEKYNARVRSIHPFTSSYESFLLFSDYERRFMDGIKIYEMYFRTARKIGAEKVILHGSKSVFKATVSCKEYFRRFDILQHYASDYGVILLQENVNNYISNSVDFVNMMKCEIPESAAFVCDIKQCRLGGIEPTDMINAMGKSLKHIHINDFSDENKCVLPGRGILDFKKIFSSVNKTGFDGDVIIEVYRHSFDKMQELKDAHSFLTAVCGEQKMEENI